MFENIPVLLLMIVLTSYVILCVLVTDNLVERLDEQPFWRWYVGFLNIFLGLIICSIILLGIVYALSFTIVTVWRFFANG